MSHISPSSQTFTSRTQQTAESAKSFRFEVPTPHYRHLERFKALYQQRFGVRLSDTQAIGKLTSLLVLVRYRRHEEALRRSLQSRPHPAEPTS